MSSVQNSKHPDRSPDLAGGGSTAGDVELLNHALEALAGSGEWSELQAVMRQRDALLGGLDAGDRARIYRSALRSNERVLALLRPVRQAVGDELLSLRRGAKRVVRYERFRNSG